MISSFSARRRAGFTLVETIVTVGLLAVIAAFVIPTVIQKAGAGDLVKVQNDVKAVQTALETFATDSKAGFPRLIASLTARPTTTSQLMDQSVVGTTNITTSQLAAWNGPYLGATISMAQKDSLGTGYLAYVMNHIVRYDATTDAPEFDANFAVPAATAFNVGNTLFAAVQIHGLTLQQAQRLNSMIDGAADASGVTNAVGRFRYNTVSTVFTAYYLAVPITAL